MTLAVSAATFVTKRPDARPVGMGVVVFGSTCVGSGSM
jgi:hypothetical protein